ncbi:MAG TPA: AMP-binding protein, partial [Mobilitalea sp.]|nr:AMP-binding protein [Mobilitalea sp.]
MQRNVLEYLEHTVMRVPDKTAYANEVMGMTFREVYDQARAIGSFLKLQGYDKESIVVFMGKHPRTIVTFYGVIYSGNYYVPIDEEMPRHRIELIFESLKPRAVLCDQDTGKLLESFPFEGKVYYYEEMITASVNVEVLHQIRDRQIDTDPIYIVFTSGSTGVPKGVVACHRSVIDYIESLSEVLKVSEATVFG